MTPVIEVDNLTKRYGATRAVDGVSFAVNEGEIFGIVGTNGAGKTTTVECLEGLRRADGGRLRVLGLDPARRAERKRLRELVGVQLQQSALQARLKVREALELYASFYRDPADWRALLADWGLTDKARSAYADLSGGQQQRLFIALALVGRPRIVFLDELTTGLDPVVRRATWEHVRRIRELGTTVVLVTHYMEEAEYLCDRVAVFDSGRIVALDTPAALVRRTGGGQRLSFRVPAGTDTGFLDALPGVARVDRAADRITVTGDEQVLTAVAAALAQRGITVSELRMAQAGLDDAFLYMTEQGR